MADNNGTGDKQLRTKNYLNVAHSKPMQVTTNVTGPAYDFLRDYLAEQKPDSIDSDATGKYLKKGPVGVWVGDLLVPAIHGLVLADGSQYTGDVVPPRTESTSGVDAKVKAQVDAKLQEMAEKIASLGSELPEALRQQLIEGLLSK